MIKDFFNKPITEIITVRNSVRTYKDEELPEEIINKLNDFMKNIENPFNKKIRFKLINIKNIDNIKLGTYGVIKGAKSFLAVTCEKDEFNLEALGYGFELLVLYATSLGLGTCWLGGTFNKGNFAKAMGLKDNEILPIVSPVGYKSDNKSIMESFFKFASKSHSRKAFEEIFFEKDFKTSLTKDSVGLYYMPLEMVRIAPSAVNKQPWLIVEDGKNWNFYNASPKDEIHRIDLGIALCHFHLAAIEMGLQGEFKKMSLPNNKEFEYVISWIEK